MAASRHSAHSLVANWANEPFVTGKTTASLSSRETVQICSVFDKCSEINKIIATQLKIWPGLSDQNASGEWQVQPVDMLHVCTQCVAIFIAVITRNAHAAI